jgi:hypothetical protein
MLLRKVTHFNKVVQCSKVTVDSIVRALLTEHLERGCANDVVAYSSMKKSQKGEYVYESAGLGMGGVESLWSKWPQQWGQKEGWMG